MRRLASILVLSAAPLLAGQKALTVERICADPPLDGVLPAEVQWLPGGARFSFIAKRGSGAGGAGLAVGRGCHHRRAPRTPRRRSPALVRRGQGRRSSRASPGTAGARRRGASCSPAAATSSSRPCAGKQVRRLTATPGEEELAEFSPDGRWVSFVRDNDLFVIELATGAETRLTDTGSPDRRNGKLDWVYEEELAGRKPIGYAWSPDSRWIAYLTLDDGKVPRYPIEDRSEAPSEDDVAALPATGRPEPGCRGVGRPGRGLGRRAHPPRPDLERRETPSTCRASAGPRTAGRCGTSCSTAPQRRLEMVREDVATGTTATLFVERDAAWINLHDEQRFFADGRLLWSTEGGGYRHLVMYAADGTPRPITSGPWEVTSVDAVDEAAGWIYFTATEAGPLERQLYRVRPDGRGFARLSREAGTPLRRCRAGRGVHPRHATQPSRALPEMRVLAARRPRAADACSRSRHRCSTASPGDHRVPDRRGRGRDDAARLAAQARRVRRDEEVPGRGLRVRRAARAGRARRLGQADRDVPSGPCRPRVPRLLARQPRFGGARPRASSARSSAASARSSSRTSSPGSRS